MYHAIIVQHDGGIIEIVSQSKKQIQAYYADKVTYIDPDYRQYESTIISGLDNIRRETSFDYSIQEIKGLSI